MRWHESQNQCLYQSTRNLDKIRDIVRREDRHWRELSQGFSVLAAARIVLAVDEF